MLIREKKCIDDVFHPFSKIYFIKKNKKKTECLNTPKTSYLLYAVHSFVTRKSLFTTAHVSYCLLTLSRLPIYRALLKAILRIPNKPSPRSQ